MSVLDLFRAPRVQTFEIKRPPISVVHGSCVAPPRPVLSAQNLEPNRARWNTGSKFPGGFGPTEVQVPDYWTLRARSAQLFETNLYARGLIRRLVENEINVGLHLEATPEEKILGKADDELAPWAEEVENRFALWAGNPAICDQGERQTFGQLQASIRYESLVAGDVLLVMRQDPRTKLPRIQIVPGEQVQTPFDLFHSSKAKVRHGVEIDGFGRHVAYHVRQEDGTSKRLPAFGEKSGRRLAWLVYGTEKRHDDVRGKPLLAHALQALREIDRYRDAAIRKAVISSLIAIFVKKDKAGPGSGLLGRGGLGGGTAETNDGTERTFAFENFLPGSIVQELREGEEPVPFSNAGTDLAFGEFEESVLATVAWGNNVPPEILTLAYSNNYSASQAAINEFKIHLLIARTDYGQQVCQPIYVDWLLASAFARRVVAPGLLEAFRDFEQHDTFSAWVSADWAGNIKPAVDLSKLVKGYIEAINAGLMTRARAARELFGLKYSKLIQQLSRENIEWAEAFKPVAELEASKKPEPTPPPGGGDPPADDAEPDEGEDTGDGEDDKETDE
jgi:capsid protein